jgi:hypothetical protein
MAKLQFDAWQISIGVAILTCLAGIAAVFAFVSPDFGSTAAGVLSLLFAVPLVIAAKYLRRMPTARWRGFAFIVALLCVVSGGVVFVVRDWYAKGMDRLHAEDVKWANFERRMRDDPAFKKVKINVTNRKNVYWASGTLPTVADRVRLDQLAEECGIVGRQLDGPFVHSISLTVEGQDGPE